jgi:DNA-binding NarL/FixJ family response regulator
MASSATTKAARRAARDATIAAQEAVAQRTRANMDNLTVFFSARERDDAVDDWLKERVEALNMQADQRRAGQLRECGVALRAMKERGESVRDIARMAGISEKTVRELIRSSTAGAPAAGGPVGAEPGAADPAVSVAGG